MGLLPDGRTERARLDGEMSAAKELRRVTEAYLARVRQLYLGLSPNMRRDIAPVMQLLRKMTGAR